MKPGFVTIEKESDIKIAEAFFRMELNINCRHRSKVTSLSYKLTCNENLGYNDTGTTTFYESNFPDAINYTKECFGKKDHIFKAGDWAFCIQYAARGWVLLKECVDVNYPLFVDDNLYAADGRFINSDEYPSLLTYNPFDPDDKPPCVEYDFKQGEVIAVWMTDSPDEINYKVFETSVESNRIIALNKYGMRGSVWDHARKLTDEEAGK